MKFLTQAAKALQEKKRYQHRLAIFLCLAVVVTLGTFAALKLSGQAMTHQRKVLNCQLEIHQHSEECYNKEEEGKLICGQADYVVHKHNDDCYNLDSGELVCRIAELEVHKHDDNCYQEEKVLVCKEEEKDAHTHTPECYIREKGDLQCVLEEHVHAEACYIRENTGLQCALEEHAHAENCYDETGALTCQQEEHQHSEDCYVWTETLNCSLEEHQHNDNCYTWTETLACQQEEMQDGHTHTDECYETKKTLLCEKEEVELHTHDENCRDENGALICEKLQVEEHIHGAECFETVELNDEEVAALNTPQPDEEEPESEDSTSSNFASENSASKNSASKNSTSGNSTSDNSASENSTSDNETGHVHDESCYDSAGGLMCGFEGETPDITKVCETEDYIVTAVYKESANIPEEAELLAELITADKDEEHYAKREAEIKEALRDENVSMNALFKIGFYVDGKEVEPESDVSITVQFLDENGLAEGSPIAIIHFADGGNQVLNGGKAKNKSTTFKTKSFSEFGIVEGYEVPGEEEGEDENTEAGEDKEEKIETIQKTIPVSKSYEYKNDMLHAVFQIEGEVSVSVNGTETKVAVDEETETVISDDEETEVSANTEESGNTVSAGETDGEENSEEEVLISANGEENADSEAEISQETGEEQEVTETEDAAKSGDAESIEEISQKLEFKVELIDETIQEYAKDYAAVTACVEEISDKEDRMMVQVLAYSLNYGDEKLDLSDCKVTMEITPTQTLVKKAKESAGKTPDGEELPNEVTLSVIQSVKSMDAGEEIETAAQEEDEVDEEEFPEETSEENEQESGEEKASEEEESESEEGPAPEDLQSIGKIIDASPVNDIDGSMTVTLDTSSNGTAVFATAATSQANPNFTVEFYANINRFAKKGDSEVSGKKSITVIDTSGKNMPVNGGEMPKKEIYLNPDPDNTVVRKTELTEVYSSSKHEYIEAPGLVYFNKLAKNKNYKLTEIRVQRKGSNDWERYSCDNGKEWHFTNKQKTWEDNKNEFIWITADAKIRLVHDVKIVKQSNGAFFYDYDVTNGEVYKSHKTSSGTYDRNGATTHDSGDVWYMYTNKQGINSNLPDQTFAFGNSEGALQTTLGEIVGNRANDQNAAYGSPTFGLVTGLTGGKLRYAGNVKAPNLFNEGSAKGKTSYTGNLIFNQEGDTYTLTGAEVIEGNKVVSEKKGVDKFTRQRDNWNKTYYFAGNDFYPMDTVSSAGKTDLLFGSPESIEVTKNFSGENKGKPFLNMPLSDDGENHNHYFGMHYTINFDLVKDYVGPLEYLFYGDDDMWVFLDGPGFNGKLICDIGGVHSSVGEYVNLWDYIKKGSEGSYQLSFFYTERGASGSTCWMQFTLPSVSFATTTQDTGQLKISKRVTGSEITDEEFGFEIQFTEADGKTPLKNDYAYTKYKNGIAIDNDILIWNDAKFTLKADEYIIISYLPEGSHYTITEVGPVTVTDKAPGGDLTWEEIEPNPYNPEITGGSSTETPGQITGVVGKNGTTVEVDYNNVRIYELPETGGSGMALYTMAGALCVMFGTGFLYKRRFRERRG